MMSLNDPNERVGVLQNTLNAISRRKLKPNFRYTFSSTQTKNEDTKQPAITECKIQDINDSYAQYEEKFNSLFPSLLNPFNTCCILRVPKAESPRTSEPVKKRKVANMKLGESAEAALTEER